MKITIFLFQILEPRIQLQERKQVQQQQQQSSIVTTAVTTTGMVQKQILKLRSIEAVEATATVEDAETAAEATAAMDESEATIPSISASGGRSNCSNANPASTQTTNCTSINLPWPLRENDEHIPHAQSSNLN